MTKPYTLKEIPPQGFSSQTYVLSGLEGDVFAKFTINGSAENERKALEKMQGTRGVPQLIDYVANTSFSNYFGDINLGRHPFKGRACKSNPRTSLLVLQYIPDAHWLTQKEVTPQHKKSLHEICTQAHERGVSLPLDFNNGGNILLAEQRVVASRLVYT